MDGRNSLQLKALILIHLYKCHLDYQRHLESYVDCLSVKGFANHHSLDACTKSSSDVAQKYEATTNKTIQVFAGRLRETARELKISEP